MNPRNVFIGVIVVVLALMLLRANKLARPFNPYRLILPTLTAEELYPRPTELPPPTKRPLNELLAEYESVLKSLSPAAHAALRPGLSEDELNRLEAEYSIVLSSDMRALYSWKDG